MTELNTSDQILAAAMELFSEKGYAAVTTKEIASKAQVSEVTLFRYFETKKALYKRVFEKYVINPGLEEAFNREPSWDLRTDLTNIAVSLQNMIKANLRLIRINMKDNKDLFDLDDQENFRKKPAMAIERLTSYFTDMKEKGKIIGEPKILAVDFFLINTSLILTLIFGQEDSKVETGEYMESMIDIFIRGTSA